MVCMRALSVIFAIWLSGTAWADVRDGDMLLPDDELTAYLSGQVLEFHDGSLASYHPDGKYEYRYTPDEPPFIGKYEISGNSTVCVEFDNGFSRCDMIVRNGDRHLMIIEKGYRFPIRSATELQ